MTSACNYIQAQVPLPKILKTQKERKQEHVRNSLIGMLVSEAAEQTAASLMHCSKVGLCVFMELLHAI